MSTKISQEVGEQRLRDVGFEPLEPFINMTTKVLVLCKCGNTFKVRPSAVYSGNTTSCGCSNPKSRRSQEEAKEKFMENGLELLDKYLGTTHKVATRCHCGTMFMCQPMHVFSGHTTSCGCSHRHSQKEIEKRFEKVGMRLLEKYDNNYTPVLAMCHCDEVFSVIPSSIFNGNTKSCGCIQRVTTEQAEKRFEKVGMKLMGRYIDNRTPVLTMCHCGEVFSVRPNNIFTGVVKSCGCIGQSAGEVFVKKILEKYGCRYIKEWTREGKRTRQSLRYDFYLPSYRAIIEFNGQQHFNKDNKFHIFAANKHNKAASQMFTELQTRDKEKRDWAAANGIPLLDINYDEIDQVEDKVWNFLMELRQRKASMAA